MLKWRNLKEYGGNLLIGHAVSDVQEAGFRTKRENLAPLLARRPDGIFAAPYEQGEIGPDLFEAACNMGLEGLVSKRADRSYQAGRSKDCS